MISITQDAELMTNIISANPVPASNRFFAFTDEKTHPSVISHGQDGKLDLIINVNDKPQLKNLGEIWKISGSVRAISLLQDVNLKVWIAVATDAGGGKSRFYLIYDVKPTALLSYSKDNIVEASDLLPEIHGIYMSNFTRTVQSKEFPLVFLALQPWDRITKEDQLAYLNISVDDSKTKVSLNTSWRLATNTLKILDVTFGTCRLGQGAFVLYKTTTGLKLQLRVFGGNDFSVELTAPSGASCLSSYVDPDTNSSVFLVGGTNITVYKYGDYNRSTGTGTKLSTDPPSGLRDIHTARYERRLTIWYTTSDDAAYYYSTTTDAINKGKLVQLLAEGEGGQISGLLYSNNDKSVSVKTLVSVDESGNLTVLQQGSDTDMWETHPLFVISERDNIEVDSFTVRIKAISDTTSNKNEYTSKCSLHLSTSGYARVLRNGRAALVDKAGAWYETDHTGVLTLIIPTADFSCQTFAIDKFKAQNGHETAINVNINPSSKLNDKLKSIKSGKALLDAKTQSGKNLIKPGTVSEKDADNAVDMIKKLNQMHINMSSPTKSDAEASLNSNTETKPKTYAGSSPWDFFLYILKKAEAVKTWFLQIVDGVTHFVCEWAGKVYRFFLNSISAIGKALSWVFAKIKVGCKAIIDFIGFIFNWDFILDYADSIVTLGNSGLEYGMNLLDGLDSKAQAFIDGLTADLKGRQQPDSVPTTPKAASLFTNDTSNDIHHGVGYNWSSYQLHHGGFKDNSTFSMDPMKRHPDGHPDGPLMDVFEDFVDEIDTITTLMKTLAHSVTKLFSGECTSSDFFNEIKEASIDAVCGTLKNLVDAFLKSVKFVLQTFKDVGNYAVNIPIFTSLWKTISKGRDLTLFNVVALITAIPASILHKLTVVCKTEAPKLKDKLDEDTFKQYVEGNTKLNSELGKEILLTATISGAAAVILGGEAALIMFMMSSVKNEENGSDISPLSGNVIDCVMFNFSMLSLICSWPRDEEFEVGLRQKVSSFFLPVS
ncbi:hypothetical protein B0O99DRAFT_700518 [Bisporella sp. PMI_857]|nr:hypothetical protein B0O99DRAFT_700518 [Bisporella sp. PMI_857]